MKTRTWTIDGEKRRISDRKLRANADVLWERFHVRTSVADLTQAMEDRRPAAATDADVRRLVEFIRGRLYRHIAEMRGLNILL